MITRLDFIPATKEQGARVSVSMNAVDLVYLYVGLKKLKTQADIDGCIRKALLDDIAKVLSVDPCFRP